MSGRLEVGDLAPDFTLPRDGAGELSLNAWAGKGVVLFFYPKDDTSGCTRESIEFTEKLDAFRALDVEVMGFSPDSAAKHDKFKAKHSLGMTLISDESKETLQAYGVWVEKSMYGKKYMGVERSTLLMDGERKIVRAWRKVKVPGHVEEVLQACKDWRAGTS